MLEYDFRHSFKHASPYWESDLLFDSVRFLTENKIIVSEIKFRHLDAQSTAKVKSHLQAKLLKSQLASRYDITAEMIDFKGAIKQICL